MRYVCMHKAGPASEAGLPPSPELVAGMGREDLLFRLAARLEEAMPWHDRRPPIAAPTTATSSR